MTLELKQTQKLSPVLTQQLQQAIKLLQLSKLELAEAIEQEMKENPILEVTEEPAENSAQEASKENDDKEDIADWLERFSPSEDYTHGITENCLIMRTVSARPTTCGTMCGGK